MSSLHEVTKRYHDVKLKNRGLGRSWSANNADVGEMNRISMVTGDVTISGCGFGFNPVAYQNRSFGIVCSVFEYVKNAKVYNDKFINADVKSDKNMGIEAIIIETKRFMFRISYNGNPDMDFHTIEIVVKRESVGLGSGGNAYAPRRFV